jgi:hypothetical protein
MSLPVLVSEKIMADGGASQGVHRTWNKILTQLLALFEKEPEIEIDPVID